MKKTNRKKQQTTRCPYCGAPMVIRSAVGIYHEAAEGERLLVCGNYPQCDTYARLCPGSNQPLGVPANRELRKIRARAHKAFDSVWKQGYMTRTDAYRWMADFMGLRRQDAHIGRFGTYQCEKVIGKCESLQRMREKK